MSTGRETCNLFFYLKKRDFKRFWYHLKKFNKLTYKDTFMPIVCYFKGHKPYAAIDSVSDINDRHIRNYAYGCSRCGIFIKNANYKLPDLDFYDTLLVNYIKRHYSKDVTYKVHQCGLKIAKGENNTNQLCTVDLEEPTFSVTFDHLPVISDKNIKIIPLNDDLHFLHERLMRDFKNYGGDKFINLEIRIVDNELLNVTLLFKKRIGLLTVKCKK
jgi:hypothetical protein